MQAPLWVNTIIAFFVFQTCHAEVQTDAVQVFPAEDRIIIVPPESHVSISTTASGCGAQHDHTYCAVQAPHDSLSEDLKEKMDAFPLPVPISTSTPRKIHVEHQSDQGEGDSTVNQSCRVDIPTMFCEQEASWEVQMESSCLAEESPATAKQTILDKTWEHPLKEPSPNADKGTDLDTDGEDDQDHSGCSARDTSYTSNNFVDSKKLLVFQDCLESLVYMTTCSTCHSPVSSVRHVEKGCNIVYHIQYLCNHSERVWSGQPFIGEGRNKMSAGNVLVCAATLFSGLTYSRLKDFSDILNMLMLCETTFYDIQSSVLIPVVNEAWTAEKLQIQAELRACDSVVLAGDGRCDSPGFNAKFCTYTFMNNADSRIVDFELVQVTQTGTSQSMEKYGFCKSLDRLLETGVKVETVVTDRHVGIRSAVKKIYSQQGVTHQFDVYHIANSFRKRLNELSKKKRHSDLVPWLKSLVNHVWFSSRRCEGNADMLVELFTSICFHVAGKHQWKGNKYVNRCLHPPYTKEEQRRKKWLKGPTLQAVKDIVLDHKLCHDIRQISLFCHTGKLESYHSALLVYCPKRLVFDYPCMMARSQLAVLQHNANCGRSQAVVKKANQASALEGEPRFKPEWKKQSGAWRARKVYEGSSKSYITNMMHRVIEVRAERLKLPVVARPLGKNIAKKPAPQKDDLVKSHIDRFR